jgi:hypothetical protein
MDHWIDPVATQADRNRGSKKKLSPGAERHYPSDSAFDKIARVVCRAGCIPRKELYESWEMAKRVRRHLRGTRIVDLACGHGLLAYALAVIMPNISEILAVDRVLPPSGARLAATMEAEWPGLVQRVTRKQADLRDVDVLAGDIVVCAHGCGALTDRVLDLAVAVRTDVAVLPCCSDHSRLDTGGLDGWLGGDLAIDVVRALRLRDEGYKVWTQHIDAEITPKNRLLLGRLNDSTRVTS